MPARVVLKRLLAAVLAAALFAPGLALAAPVAPQPIDAPWGGLRRSLPMMRPLGLAAPLALSAASTDVTLTSTPANYITVMYGMPAYVYQGVYVNDNAFPVEDIFLQVKVFAEPAHTLLEQVYVPTDDYILASGGKGTYALPVPIDSSYSFEVSGPFAKQSWSVPKPLKATVTTMTLDPATGERHYLGTVTNESSVTVLADIKIVGQEKVDGAFFCTARDEETYQSGVVLGPGKSTGFDAIASRPTGGKVPVLEDLKAEGLYPTVLSVKASDTSPSYGTYFKLTGTLKAQLPTWSLVPSETVWMWGYSERDDKDFERKVAWNPSYGYATWYRVYYGTYFGMVFEGDSNYAYAESDELYIRPHVYLSKPVAPTTVRRGRAFTAYGYLKPYHSGYTKIQAYRYERGKWVLRKTVNARNSKYSSYSKYAVSTTVPYAGKWRIRAYAPADSYHSATYSSYRYFTAK